MAHARREQPDPRDPRLSLKGARKPLESLPRAAGDLPHIDQHWVGGWRVFDNVDGGSRNAAIVWMEHPSLLVRSYTLVDEESASEALVLDLFAAMAAPLPGCVRGVPRRLSVSESALASPLARLLGPLGVQVETRVSRDAEDALQFVATSLAYGELAYLHAPGADPGLLRRFFSHCADLWRRRLCERGRAGELFRIDGLRPFPVLASLSREGGESCVRIYIGHLDCVLGDIWQTPSVRGVRVLFLVYVQAREVQAAFSEEARRGGWDLPRHDVAPVLSVARADEGPCSPDADDFAVAADVLEALLTWDGERGLDGRTSRTLRSGRRVRVAGPGPLSGEAAFPSAPR